MATRETETRGAPPDTREVASNGVNFGERANVSCFGSQGVPYVEKRISWRVIR